MEWSPTTRIIENKERQIPLIAPCTSRGGVMGHYIDMRTSFVRGIMCWEGDHVRLVLTHKESKGLTKALVGDVSSCLRKIGCRCVLDEQVRNQCRSKLLKC